MGVYIAPCAGCPVKNGCTQREIFRQRARGLGASSVRFRCNLVANALRVGRRITILQPIGVEVSGQYEPEISIRRAVVRATINGLSARYDFSCVIDKGEIERAQRYYPNCAEEWTPEDIERRRYRRYQKPSRIQTFLDEPDWLQCPHGTMHAPDSVCDGGKGPQCWCGRGDLPIPEPGDAP